MKRSIAIPMASGLIGLLLVAAPAGAQERRGQPAREAEVRELEELLRRVDAAIGALQPLATPEVTFRQYDARQLFYRPDDRSAPDLSVPGEAAGYRTGSGGGAAGSFSFDAGEEEYGGLFEPEVIEELLQEAAGGEAAWTDGTSLELHEGYFLVHQTAVGHARIEAALESLRQTALRGVQLEVGFYALPPELQDQLEAAAAGAQGVLAPRVLQALDAWVDGGQATLTASGLLTALNEQRVFLHHGVEQTYVGDYEHSSGGTGTTVEKVADPIVEVLRTGLALEVRPTVQGEGRQASIALDVRFTRSLALSAERRTTPWGPLLTPRLGLDSVRTSAAVPPDSGMLVFSTRGGAGGAAEEAGIPRDVVIVVRPRLVGR